MSAQWPVTGGSAFPVGGGTTTSPSLSITSASQGLYDSGYQGWHSSPNAVGLSTTGTGGASLFQFVNVSGGIPVFGSPASSLAIIAGLSSGGPGCEIRLFNRQGAQSGSALFLCDLGDYNGNTSLIGVDDFRNISPFKCAFIGTDGIGVGFPITGAYPTIKPTQKVDIRETTAATAVYLRVSSAVTGVTDANGLKIGLDASGVGQINNQQNTDLVLSTNNTAAATVKANGNLLVAGGIGVGNSAAATTPGSVVKKIQVFDAAGTSLGFIAVYNTIT